MQSVNTISKKRNNAVRTKNNLQVQSFSRLVIAVRKSDIKYRKLH